MDAQTGHDGHAGSTAEQGAARLGTVAGLVSELSELTSLVLATDGLDRVVWEAAMLAVHAADEVDACGVTVLREGAPLSLMPETASFGQLERYQYEHDAGPLMTAMAQRRTVVVTLAEALETWRGYGALARQLGVAATMVVPLVVGDEVLGALSLYATCDEHDLTRARRLGELVADLASTALSCMARHAEQSKLTEELRGALTSRAVIEQAKGILMTGHGHDEDAAFSVLRGASQNHNIKLRDVAAIVVDTTTARTGGGAPAASVAQQARKR